MIVLAAFTAVAPMLTVVARAALVLILAMTLVSRGVLNVAMAGWGGEPTY